MPIKGINHFLFSVSDLEKSIDFYKNVFDAKLLVKGNSTAYFDVAGIWLALNVEKDIPRNEISQSYTHIAFSVDEADFDVLHNKLQETGSRFISQTRTGINSSSIPAPCRTGLIITGRKKGI